MEQGKKPLPETPMSYPKVRPPVAAIMHEIMTMGVIFASKSLPPPLVTKPPPAMVVSASFTSSLQRFCDVHTCMSILKPIKTKRKQIRL